MKCSRQMTYPSALKQVLFMGLFSSWSVRSNNESQLAKKFLSNVCIQFIYNLINTILSSSSALVWNLRLHKVILLYCGQSNVLYVLSNTGTTDKALMYLLGFNRLIPAINQHA